MTRRETTAAPVTTKPSCPACGGPPASSEDHDDRACPLTRTPGVVQRGRFAPRRTPTRLRRRAARRRRPVGYRRHPV